MEPSDKMLSRLFGLLPWRHGSLDRSCRSSLEQSAEEFHLSRNTVRSNWTVFDKTAAPEEIDSPLWNSRQLKWIEPGCRRREKMRKRSIVSRALAPNSAESCNALGTQGIRCVS